MKKLIFIVLIGLTSMQAFADYTFADTGVGVSSTCGGARSDADSGMRRAGGTTITSKSMGSCKKSPDDEGYIVRWAITGYYGHIDSDHSHSGSSNAQSGSAKSFTTKKSK